MSGQIFGNKRSGTKKDWVDFKEIKEKTKIERALKHYGLTSCLKKRGDEMVGAYPFCGKVGSFFANAVKNVFQCFA